MEYVMQDGRGGGISGPSEPKGWSDAEVDTAIAHLAVIETKATETVTAAQTTLDQVALLNDQLTWLYFFIILMIGYQVARHFTPSERELTR